MLNHKQIRKTFVLQHDQSDCGVACLLSLIRYYGGNESLEKLREYSGTTRQGTTLLGLYQAANQIGFEAEGCEADIPSLIKHANPVILHVVVQEKLQHYVVCFGYENGKFLIGDPAQGISELSTEELNKIWISKTCLILSTTVAFQKEENAKKLQRNWFYSLIKEDIKLLFISSLLGIIIATLGLAMAIFSQKLIDDILPTKNVIKLISGIVLLAILLLARVGISVLREYFLLRQSKDFNNRINNQFFTNLLSLPKLFFDTRKIGELIARLNDTQRIQRVIKQLAGSLAIDVLVVIMTITFLFYYSWEIGLLSVLTMPIYFYIIYRSNSKIIHSQKEVMQGYAMIESNYITSLQGITEIKINNKQTIFSKLNAVLFGNFQDKIFQLGKINIRLSWQSGVASILFLIGVLIYTSLQVLNEKMQVGELMAIITMAGSLLPSVLNLALITIPINEAKIAFLRMYEFSSIVPEKNEGTNISDVQHIEIKNIAFRFVGRKQILSDVNLHLQKGKVTAIIGESGCGKSTLAQILLQFYLPEKGEIIIDNCLLQDICLKSYRGLVGFIPQEIAIFNGNVIDNITLGEEVSIEEINLFLHKYGFDTYFNEFPQGLFTLLGEEGINLSGGQKQLISFARTLFKNPKLLILDESTSAMDRNTEHFFLSVLQKIKPEKIILFISHRLHSLPKIADEICILENGKIEFSGNHNELMEFSNFYSDFWK
ncbi:peptidase domain-containing ABC transporter [Capnocytophaga cynodegmi]|uniref:ABC transporter, ATP-binding protein n=1 Tax=Capnocytophaga cynodegmi TaxID=28189 RepID=A0A0B7HLK2_9FLAO|nr:peptidase domain-containing ABC transporter [Capnocytophaga cynodegmi]CEN38732.1 ABC transporter, ATP-binding protein [Capnocytophaga cynodegmi]